MTLLELAFLGAAVGANNLAVALALGALGQNVRRARVVLVFGAFEFTVPLVGIWMGSAAASAVGASSQMVGGLLLGGLGVVAVVSGFRGRRESESLAKKVTSWAGVMALAAGLSIDNVIVGFSLGLGNAEPLVVASTIAAFSMGFTWLGLRLGRESRRRWETAAALGAGVLLVLLGLGVGFGLI